MLYFDLKKLEKLDAKRSPMFEKNRIAKVMVYAGIAFWAAYFMFIGVMLALALEEAFPNMEPYHMLNKGLVIILGLDFLIRFMLPTPVQVIKPFLLLPVARDKVLSMLILRAAANPFNLLWLFLVVPFALLTVTRFYGLPGIIGYALGIWLLSVMNGYWSMLVKVLKRQHILWLLLVVPVYGGLALLEFVPEEGWVSTFTMNLGEGFICWQAWSFLLVLAGIGVMGAVNFFVQRRLVRNEIARPESTNVKHISSYRFFDRYGSVGEYMRLELKMLFRNKTPRTQFWMFIVLMATFALFLAVDLYEGSFMNNFICIYCYSVLGLLTLSQIMAIEGNYIDGLMVRREMVFNMICGKYYLQGMFLLIPFCMNMVSVFLGTVPFLMVFSYLFFTMGVIFPIVMQMAVYNDKTMQLNVSVTGKRQNANWYQSLIVIAAFGVPMLINRLLLVFFDETASFVAMMVMGIAGILTHRWWIHNIYVRFMKRRYKNMEGFRNTR